MKLSEANLLIVPGSSRYSRYWANDIRKLFDRNFGFTMMHRHRHWEENDDRDLEIFTEAGKLYEYEDRYKSIGILAYNEGILPVLKAVHEKKINPPFCIFISFPYHWSYHKGFLDEAREWSAGFEPPSLFIQAMYDPMGDFDKIKEFVNGRFKGYSLKEIRGSDSNYDDVYELYEISQKFVKKV